jgi:hypothetical protein
MMHHNQKLCSAILKGISILTLFTLFACTSGVATDVPLGFSGSDNAMENYFSGGTGQDSSSMNDPFGDSLTIAPIEKTTSRISPVADSSAQTLVAISPFTVSKSGETINLIFGHFSGDLAEATITITGKKASDADYSDITTVTTDKNGLFIWEVVDEQKDVEQFQVTAKSGTDTVKSNAINFIAESETPSISPAISPVVVSTTKPTQTPVQIPVQTPSDSSSPKVPTRLTISTTMTTPAVGESFSISGQLTDQDGNGVSGATITIDEEGYSGSDHLSTTQTDSDGSFEFSVGVAYAYTVGFVADYAGDENHNSAQSNTLTFTAYEG